MFVPKYNLSEAFYSRLGKIDEANTYLRQLVFPAERMKQLKDEVIATSVSLIVRAEDSSVGYGRVARILDAMDTPSPAVDVTERQISRIHSILEAIRKPLSSGEIVSESIFHTWYHVMEQRSERCDTKDNETIGYRISPKEIQENSDKIIYSAAPHHKLKSLVSDLFDWLKYEAKGVHPILKGIIAYFQILIIRPFLKNNGKLGWFLLLAILKEHGFDFGEYVSLEKGVFVEREHFHNNILRLITTTYDSENYFSSDFQPYIIYLLPFLENTVIETRFLLEREHPKVVGEMLKKADLNERKRRALSYILKENRITNREYIELNGIKSRKLAWEELNQMVANEILRRVGQGRDVCYTMSSIVTKETIQKHLGNN